MIMRRFYRYPVMSVDRNGWECMKRLQGVFYLDGMLLVCVADNAKVMVKGQVMIPKDVREVYGE